MQRFQHGGLAGGSPFGDQFGGQLHSQGLLVAREPDAGPAVGAAALQFHCIKFFLELLGVLLQLLGLLEGLGELTEVGESEASHALEVARLRLRGS